MDELKNAISSVAYQQAHLPPEPELAARISLFLADQVAALGRMTARDGRVGQVGPAEDGPSTE